MKFLCDNCKAKYQLADDKVAGRTVRMKCRKCGHLIEVNSSVTETSVAAERPVEPAADATAAPAEPTPAPTDAPAPEKPAASPPRPGAPPPRPSAARPLVPPKPTPSSPKPAELAGASSKGPAGASSRALAGGSSKALAGGSSKALAGGSSKGLAGAFSKAVADVPVSDESSVSTAMDVLSTGSSAEEWYVGINGVPVGPVRLTELRRKAATGAVTLDSLVWREGFEEWTPLRTYPELAAMVADAAATGHASLTPSPPATTSARPAPARPSAPARPAAAPPPRPATRSNVVPITSRLATAEKLDPVATEPEPPKPEPVPPEPPKPEPAAAVAPVPLVATPALDDHSDSIVAPVRRSRRRVHPAAWAVVALAGVLGGIFLGLSLGGKPKPQVQVVTVTVPAVATDVPPPPPTAEPTSSATTIDTVAVAAGPKTGGSSGATTKAGGEGKGAAPVASQAPSGPGPATGLAGLAGLTGGPTVGPAGGTPSGGGGGALAQADIERVVQSHRAFVKRQCWESALATKSPSAPSSARVSVSITIASDGHVSGASASGGDGYPGLASCVQGQVRNWRFPPSDGASVNVPFVFAAQ